MKRLWLGIGILLLLLALSLGMDVGSRKLQEPVTQTLSAAAEAALAEDWPRARDLAASAEAQWRKHWNLAAAVTDHNLLDRADAAFAQLPLYAGDRQSTAFAGVCMELKVYLEALADDHHLKWWNLL